MKRCTVCGMHQGENPAHGAEYKGVGVHTFTPETGVNDDIVVNFGGELKAVGENGFEGYLVRFSSAEDPDLVGDYFTKATEFFIEDGAVIPVLYDHGLNPTMKKTKIGRATVSYTDEGLFIKGELETAENYKKFVKEIKDKLIKAGKAGLSSGAASHMVERKQIKKGINEIKSWGIAEGSVTPAPTEPRCEVVSLKSYFEYREDPLSDQDETGDEEFKTIKEEGGKFVLYSKDGKKKLGTHDTKQEAIDQEVAIAKSKKKKMGGMSKATADDDQDPEDANAIAVNGSIKGLYEEKLAEKTPCVWELRSVLDDVYKDIANAASVSEITGVTIDVEAKVKEAKMEEATREVPLVVKQINDYVEKGGNTNGDRYFYIRSIQDTDLAEASVKGGLGDGLILDGHSERVVHAIEEYAKLGAALEGEIKTLVERCIKKIEYRAKDPVKSGRTLSKATIEKLNTINETVEPILESGKKLKESVTNLLTLAEPKEATPDPVSLLQMEYMMTQNQTAAALEGLPAS